MINKFNNSYSIKTRLILFNLSNLPLIKLFKNKFKILTDILSKNFNKNIDGKYYRSMIYLMFN